MTTPSAALGGTPMSESLNPSLDDPRRSNVTITNDVRAAVLADLRAQVEALRNEAADSPDQWDDYSEAAFQTVLDLIDTAPDPRPGPLSPLAASPPAAPGFPRRAGTSPRDELVAAVEDAILRVDGRVSDRAIAAAIDAAAPLIRAGLRAQVEALRRQHGPGRAHDGLYTYPCSRCDALEEVLALFDGGGDE